MGHPSTLRSRHPSFPWAMAAGMSLLTACRAALAAETVFPDREWVVRSPEQADLDPSKLDAFATRVGGDGVVVRNGCLVKTWGDPAKRGDWASASKPVISTFLFFAVEEKRVPSVDASVRPWVQKRWPGKDLIEKDHTMTFRHLGDMTSGYARAEAPGVYGFNWWFNERVPGTDRFLTPGLPRDTVQANGHWGKEVMIIIPSLRMVAAARGNWGGMELRHAQLLMEAVTDPRPGAQAAP